MLRAESLVLGEAATLGDWPEWWELGGGDREPVHVDQCAFMSGKARCTCGLGLAEAMARILAASAKPKWDVSAEVERELEWLREGGL